MEKVLKIHLMRITESEKKVIIQTVRFVSNNLLNQEPLLIALFGSRTDDLKKGGDIDLLIEFPFFDENQLRLLKRKLRVGLGDSLGEQKFDLVIDWPKNPKKDFIEHIKGEMIVLWKK